MERLRNVPWGHLGYLAAIGFFGSIALGFFSVVMIEANGPSEQQPGTVMRRAETEREQCYGGPNTLQDICETVPAFTVIGSRADGSLWVLVGQGPFDAVSVGESVEVTTSSVTGRVVALDGENSWSLRTSGWYPVSILLLVFATLLGVGFEVQRRTGRSITGPFQRSDFVMLLPAASAGFALVWFVLFWRTFSLDV